MERFYDPMLRELRKYHESIARIADLVKRTPIPQLIARTGAVHWYLAPWSAMEDYFEHVFSMNTEFLLTVVRRMGEHTAKDVLPRIEVPTLVIAGEKDPFTPPSVAWEMHRDIRGSEILVIPNGTHVAQIEHPDLVGLRVEKFLLDHALLDPAPARGARRLARGNGRARAAGPARASPRPVRRPGSPRPRRAPKPGGASKHALRRASRPS